MTEKVSYAYYKFLNSITILDGKITQGVYVPKTKNVLGVEFSKSLSRSAIELYNKGIIKDTYTPDFRIEEEGFVPFFVRLGKDSNNIEIVSLFESIMLEATTLIYISQSGTTTIPYFTEQDISRVHTNIGILINKLYQLETEYGRLNAILSLRDLDKNLLYLFSVYAPLDYSITGYTENKVFNGRTNLLPPMTGDGRWVDKVLYNKADTITEIKDDEGYFLSLTSDKAISLRTKPIPVYPSSIYSIRANTNNVVSINAVDEDNNYIKVVDEQGSVHADGLIAKTQNNLGDIQQYSGFQVPRDVRYISLSFDLTVEESNKYYIRNLILVEGRNIGTLDGTV